MGKNYVILDRNIGAIQWLGSASSEQDSIEELAHDIGQNPEDLKKWMIVFEICSKERHMLEDLLDKYGPDMAARAIGPDGTIDPTRV